MKFWIVLFHLLIFSCVVWSATVHSLSSANTKHARHASSAAIHRHSSEASAHILNAQRPIASKGISASKHTTAQHSSRIVSDKKIHDDKDAKDHKKWAAFNPRHASEVLEKYLEQHPEVASEELSWVIVGAVFLLIATSLLLFSEIRAVLVIREQDFRQHMVAGNYMYPTETLKGIEATEDKVMSERPYLTMFSMIMLFVSMVCLLKPFCNVLDIIGLPSSSCFLTVGFSAFVASVTTTCLLMGLCWSCTRGVAACVLLGIALTGDVLCPTGSPVLVVSWLLFAGAVYLLYFMYLPEQESVPVWCQSIGPVRPSMDPDHWRKTLSRPNAATPASAAPPLLDRTSAEAWVQSYGAVPVHVSSGRASCTV